MKISIAAIAAALVGSVVAIDKSFGIQARRSGSQIHFSSLEAADFKIWIAVPAKPFCPKNLDAKFCPHGKGTSFVLGDQGGMALKVVVPGGQDIFVDVNGALGYTQAHSTMVPDGADRAGWSYSEESGLLYKNNALVACPAPTGGYQVVSSTSVFANAQCIPFKAVALIDDKNEAQAFQYQ